MSDQERAGGPVEALRASLAGKDEDDRRNAYAWMWRNGRAATEPVRRQAVIELFASQIDDETPFLQQQLLKWLQDFERADFKSKASSDLLRIPWTSDFAPAIIRVLGIVEVPDAVPALRREAASSLSENPSERYQSNAWTAMLALARMGDSAALQRVLATVQEESNIVRRTVLFRDLAYTRQRAAFELLARYVNSAERLPRVKDNVPGRLEAAYAAAAFVGKVKEFPLDDPDLNEREVLRAREWINSHTWELK